MPHLTLTDNNIKNQPSLTTLLQNNVQSQIHAFQDLQSIAGKSLQDLCKNKSNLLVFPHCLNEHNNGIEELFICELVGKPNYDGDTICDVENVKVRTGNLMGFIGLGGNKNHNTKLEIRSRFTENTNANVQDYFLHYMLEKVFRINLFDMNYSHSKNDGFDLLFLIFPYLLKRALRQGIFRTYRTFHKNDAAVKGVIDINRHIKQNTPFNGKIAYHSREYSADNDITQLIRHTIEFLKQKEIGNSLLNSDNDAKDAVKQIVAATDSSYCFQNRAKVIHNNLRPINHPYYSGYKYLQQLCLLILRHQSMQYSQSNSPVYGILFDGAWLWEEYLATILCNPKLAEKQFLHPSNKTGKGGIRLFDNSKNDDDEIAFSKCYRRIYPDFYRKNKLSVQAESEKLGSSENDSIILDAKYKHLENGFVRDDLYQIISYMHTMKIATGGFIYPKKVDDGLLRRFAPRNDKKMLAFSNDKEMLASCHDRTKLDFFNVEDYCFSGERGFEAVDFEFLKTYKLANDTGTVSRIAFPVPQNAKKYSEFKIFMENAEKSMLNPFLRTIP